MKPLRQYASAVKHDRPSHADLGLTVTISIASRIRKTGQVVVVTDRRLSFSDIVTASDDATSKAFGISPHWGMSFAADDAMYFNPLCQRTISNLAEMAATREAENFDDVRDAAVTAYKSMFHDTFVDTYLSRLGFSSVVDFRRTGLTELGEKSFCETIKKLDEFDLGISLIVFGYDVINKVPHVFKVENPGRFVDHDLIGYAVVGSGYWMAMASLASHSIKFGSLETIVYRLCEAKFCAETASGVGKTTTVTILHPDGRMTSLTGDHIETIRKAWETTRETPIPEVTASTIADAIAKRSRVPAFEWPKPDTGKTTQ